MLFQTFCYALDVAESRCDNVTQALALSGVRLVEDRKPGEAPKLRQIHRRIKKKGFKK